MISIFRIEKVMHIFEALNPASPVSDQISVLLQLLWFVFFISFFFLYPMFGQRAQMAFLLRDIEKKLNRLKLISDEVKQRTIQGIRQNGGADPEEVLSQKLEGLLEYFYIQPESMDPVGIVYKLEHILNIGENRFEEQVASLVPSAPIHKVKSLTNLVEVARAVNFIYRVVRHYYLVGKKTANYVLALQLQMQLPLIMEIAEAYRGASFAFLNGQPIGDGVGVLVAAKFARESKIISTSEVVKDTSVSLAEFEGRKVYIVRATGPGGTVGKPGDAVLKVINESNEKIDLIITVDAALKLEGEETGKVIEGVGVAIGGPGVDKFKIETIAREKNIPLYAIVIYQSITEAITPLKESIVKSAETALARVKQLIKEKAPESGVVILAGIGNTIGIGM
jgi:hypothetical protein